jgi:TonB-dependent receptor
VGEEGDPEISSVTLTDVLRNRNRYGATLVLDYKYDTGSIGFLNFYSRSNTTNTLRSELYEIESDNLFNSATYGINELDVLSNLLSIKQDLVGFHFDLKLSHSYSGSHNPEDVRFNFWQDIAGFRDRYLALRYDPPTEIASHVVYNPDQSVFFDIYNVSNISKDRTYSAAFDVAKDATFSNNLSGSFKAGAAYQHRSRSYDYNESSGSVFYDDGGQVSGSIRQAHPEFGDNITYSDFVDNNYSYGSFLSGDFELGSPMNVDLMRDVIVIAKNNPGTGNGGGYKPRELPSLLYDYGGKEERSAAYAMSTIKIGDMLAVIPGVRYQNLTTNYEGIRGEQVPGGLQYTVAKETQSHGFWLPMAHLRFKPVDWVQFHFAYTNTLNYPDYNTIIPRYYVGSNFILYNNYELNPATSENFDAIVSFYSNHIGLFSVGGYKKSINDLIFSSRSNPSRADYQRNYPELYELIKDRTENYSLLTYINNPFDIDVWGMETEWQTHFWYLPDPLSGIVLNVNYTHIFSEAQYPKSYFVTYPPSEETNWIPKTDTVNTYYSSRLLNQPKDVFNVSVGYDYKGFSLRVSMLYKDNIFKNPDFWASNWVQSNKYSRLDLSVKQRLPWRNIQAFFNLNNLTGEDDVDIVDRTKIVTSQQRYGMTADMGLRFGF